MNKGKEFIRGNTYYMSTTTTIFVPVESKDLIEEEGTATSFECIGHFFRFDKLDKVVAVAAAATAATPQGGNQSSLQ